MRTLTLATVLGMMISTVVLAGDSIKLRDEKTDAEYGPVKIDNGAKIKVGETTLVVTVIKQTVAQKALEQKLKKIVIPEMNFRQANVQNALAFLRGKARELDPEKNGVNILSVFPAGDSSAQLGLTLELRNVSLYDALRYCCDASGITMRIDDNAVVLTP